MLGTFDLSILNGQNGFAIPGISANDNSGFSLGSAGDVNGDGIADFLIGAPGLTVTGKTGISYVIFGRTGIGGLGTFDLSTLNGVNGFSISGTAINDENGVSVNSAGDINGDGITDIIIGSLTASPNSKTNAGSSYVIFGKKNIGSTGTFSLSALNGSNGFIIPGLTAGDNCGRFVSTAGDINADGVMDILIGAFYASPGGKSQAGTIYVIFGKSNIGSTGVFDLSTLNGTNGFAIPGLTAGDRIGYAITTLGDVNRDDVADIIFGSLWASPDGKTNAGTSYVVFGKTGIGNTGIFDLSMLNGTNGFIVPGLVAQDLSGISVSSAGDVNDDKVVDILIGAYQASPGGKLLAGTSYVIFGSAEISSTGIFNLSTLNGTNGFMIPGLTAGDQSGQCVNTAGDVNGDGIADILIGAYKASPNGKTNAGTSYLVFGRSGIGGTGTFDLSTIDGTTGITITGVTATDWSGWYASNAGDINTDGVADILVSAYPASPNGQTYAGISYAIFGDRFLVNPNQLTVNQGDTILLTPNNFNATDTFYSANALLFSVNNIRYGHFEFINNPGAAISTFYQSEINSEQVVFVHDGSQHAPLCTLTISNPGLFQLPRQTTSVSFTLPPLIVNNTLTIKRGETITLDNTNLAATDPNFGANALMFTVSNVQHGQFTPVNQSSIVLNTFLQAQIMTGHIQFIHDGSVHTPGYALSVNDGRLSNFNGPQAATINFSQDVTTNSSSNSIGIIVGGAIGGALGVAAIISLGVIYTKNKSKQILEQAIEDSGNRDGAFRRNIFSPILKEIYRRIEISTYLGQLDKKTADRFVIAIQTLIEELEKKGVDLNLEKMVPENQQRLLNEIVRHIRFYAIPNSTFQCCRFFKAEVTPIQIQDKAHAIAQGVHASIQSMPSKPEPEAIEFEENTTPYTPLLSGGK